MERNANDIPCWLPEESKIVITEVLDPAGRFVPGFILGVVKTQRCDLEGREPYTILIVQYEECGSGYHGIAECEITSEQYRWKAIDKTYVSRISYARNSPYQYDFLLKE